MFRARLIGLRNGALLLEHGGAGSARALSEVVPSENDVASTSGSKLLPPVGRELLAAVKLGLPGAKEEFDKQQRLFEKRFGARRMGRMYNETGNFRGMWKKETQFAAKDTVSPPLSLSLSITSAAAAANPSHTQLGYYKILGLEGQEGSASAVDIKQAFRREAKRLHPDTKPSGSTSGSDEQFRFLVKAYSVLKEDSTRASYDAA